MELLINYCNFSVNILICFIYSQIDFKFHSIGAEFTINNDKNDKLFNFEKFPINNARFQQSLNEYLQ